MQIQIINSQLEGEHKLKLVQCVKISYERLILLILLCICTGFLAAFYFRWFPSQFNNFIYLDSTLEKASHVKTFPFDEICKIEHCGKKVWFQFRFLKYQLFLNQFKTLEYEPQHNQSLTNQEVKNLREDFGFAQMKIPIINFSEFALEELSTPFYTLQYICMVIWVIQGFFYFAIVMMSCSLISTLIKFTLVKQSRNRLQSLASISQEVIVMRNEKFSQIDSNELVPGDIIKLQTMIVPADCILTGMALLNEATLTGESNPVPKQTGQILFEGTKILEANQNSTAQIIRTNYCTIRGQYFRNVLFPPIIAHKFYVQAMKFLAGFAIFAIIIAAATIIIYIDYSTELIIASVIGTLTWIFPPAMPIFFSLTGTIALLRLKKENIIGSNMDKIHISGQVNVTCFDKTGTLTTNELIVKQLWEKNNCLLCISCCHHICQSNNLLVGDILDLEMFKFSQAQIEFLQEFSLITTKNQEQCKIIKIFDFNSELMMMSVIVQFQDKYYLCSKGAPEKLQLLINNQDTDRQTQLQIFVNQGFRVITLAQKELQSNEIILERNELEKDLEFFGYLVFENPLKNDTASVIKQLINSNLKVKILSGDNPLTTINTAFQIEIGKEKVKLFDYSKVQQKIIECDIIRYQGKQEIIDQKQYFLNKEDFQNYIYIQKDQFALTGDFMEFCKTLNIDTNSLYRECIVFSRVKPHQKQEIVAQYQSFHNCVAMIGDGSNDCSAISQADIGVSFSQADASYTAHFSSLDQSIHCIISILAQGRATAQTLSEIFPLYILLSFLATQAYTCLALEGQNYSDFQLLFLSFLCYIPIMASMTMSKALKSLSKELPLDDMFSINNQLSFYIRVCIYVGGLIISVVIVMNSHGHYFNIPTKPIQEYVRKGMLNSVTVIIAQIYSQFIPLNLMISKPFKEYFYQNFTYLIYSSVSFLSTLLFLFYKPSQSFLGLVDFNSEIEHFDLYLLLIMACTIILDFLIQRILQFKFPRKKYL